MKKNIKKSEKKLRFVLKTGVCVLAIIGTYMVAPVILDKINALETEKKERILKRQSMEMERKLAREKSIRERFDSELIKEIDALEKNNVLRYVSGSVALKALSDRHNVAYADGKMSEFEYNILVQQFNKRSNQLSQMEGKINDGEHPLIEMILKERNQSARIDGNGVNQSIQIHTNMR